MKKKLSRLLAFILIMSLLTFSAGCSKQDDKPADNPSANSDEGNNSQQVNNNAGNSANNATDLDSGSQGTVDMADVKADIIQSYELPLSTELEEYTKAYDQLKNYHINAPSEYKTFFDYVEKVRDLGIEYKAVGANIAGKFFIHYSGSCVTSLRNCIDEILKKRGVTVEEGIYSDWNDIVSLNYVCPAPYYMQSVYNVYAGDMEKAKEFYTLAKLNESNFPEGIDKLDGISSKSDAELKELREELVNFENYLYGIYPAIPTGWETTGYEFMPEFFVSAYYYCLETEDYENALAYVDMAVRCNPLDTQLYKAAALTASMVNDDVSMWDYINNGLMLDNEAGDIVTMAVVFWVTVEDYENASKYLEYARMGSLSPENEQILKNAEAKIKEAGK